MLSFILAVAASALALQLFHRSTEKKEAKQDEAHRQEKNIRFLSSEDCQMIFKETKELFEQAIQACQSNSTFGNIGHHHTLETSYAPYKIKLTIEPTQILWTVHDMSQSEGVYSHQMFAMTYDRSLQQCSYDEFRINEGKKYSFDSLSVYKDTRGLLPFSFLQTFNTLNDAGWNKQHRHEATGKTDKPKPLADSLSTTRIRQLLSANQEAMDETLYTTFQSICSLIDNILKDNAESSDEGTFSDIEFQHNLEHLLHKELLHILEIYLSLDESHKAEVKEMTEQTLKKAQHRLAEQYAAFQQKKVHQLKQVHLVMDKRYD